MFYIQKKELQAFPFDKLFQYVYGELKELKASLDSDAKSLHDRDVERRIKLIYSGREDSYEGNPEEDFPFSGVDSDLLEKELERVKKEKIHLFCEKYDLAANATWLMPQLSAYIAKIPLDRTDSGKYDPLSIHRALGSDDWHRGIYYLIMHTVRGDFVNKQYTLESRNYSALVPLALAPFKKFDNIQYKDWDTTNLHKVIEPNLYKAMTMEFDISSVPIEEILEARDKGLTFQTGKNPGSKRNPVTTYKLYGLPPPFNKMPALAQNMLFQVWVAHPTNRTELMVLDWKDWDSMPSPLIDINVGLTTPVIKKATVTKKEVADTLPWDV